jgi:hypothetical protein
MFNSFLNFAFPVYIFVPFILFAIAGFTSAIIMPREQMSRSIISVINQVKSVDQIEINNISYSFKNFTCDVLLLIKLLISTNNLQGYKIIDNSIVTKEDVYVSTEKGEVAKTYTCYACGAELSKSDLYCPKCGRRR